MKTFLFLMFAILAFGVAIPSCTRASAQNVPPDGGVVTGTPGSTIVLVKQVAPPMPGANVRQPSKPCYFEANAQCPAGAMALSGGCDVQPANVTDASYGWFSYHIAYSRPSLDGSGQPVGHECGWGNMYNAQAPTNTIVYVTCLVPPASM